jgi:hypothetical protein
MMTYRQQRCARKEGSAEIRPGERMALWIYNKKFLMGIQFLFRTLSFTVGEDDDLEHPAQEQECANDRLQVPSRPQELSDHVSNGSQTTSYDKSDRQSGTTTDRDSIDDYPILWVSPW